MASVQACDKNHVALSLPSPCLPWLPLNEVSWLRCITRIPIVIWRRRGKRKHQTCVFVFFMLYREYSSRRCIRLAVSDLQTNRTYEHACGMELFTKCSFKFKRRLCINLDFFFFITYYKQGLVYHVCMPCLYLACGEIWRVCHIWQTLGLLHLRQDDVQYGVVSSLVVTRPRYIEVHKHRTH